MRPLELTVEGFRSYRQRATFDWRGRRLVGVVGPIGSGKSSLLDAMTFALYGKTPTYEAATRSLIHQQLDQGHVELRFSVDGQVWRAARGLRRKGQSGHQLERLASDATDAERLETVTGEAPVTARVTALLGMDFKTFCRSVLLAQNRFAEFLHARPGERDQVLKGVFGLERLDRAHEVGKGRLAAAKAELDAVAIEMGRVADARERLPEAEAEGKEAGERAARLTKLTPEVNRIDDAIGSARAAAATAAARIGEVEELTRGLPALEDIDRISGEGEEAEAAVREATAAAKEAEERRRAAEKEAAAAEKTAGGRERLEEGAELIVRLDHELTAAESCRARTESADQDAATAGRNVEAAAARVEQTKATAAEAEEASVDARRVVLEAEATLEEARHVDMAVELRGGLVPGEPCPVCARPVAALPAKGRRAAKASAAGKALDRARAAEDQRRGAADAVRAALAGARERATASDETLEKAQLARKAVAAELAVSERAVLQTERRLTQLLGTGDPVEELSARRKAVAAARDVVKDAEERGRAAATEHDRAREQAERLREELAEVAARLSGVWGRLGESRTVERAPDALRVAFGDIGAKLLSAHEEAVAARDASTASEAEASVVLESLYREAGVTTDRPFAEAVTDAATAHGAAKTRVDELRRVLASQGALTARVKKIERRRDLAERLSDDLRPSAFLRFLLEEERAELAALGSEHFQDLTGGSYRFSGDGEFAVLDMNAGATERRADSLSGGETFLASLALALALAEMVARGGGRMDAFLLDEGFGSLDPDHLDKAMEGIEQLVAESEHRLVVVVSHVAAMRDAIDDLVVLDKDPTTGDTIVRAGAEFGSSI